MRMDTSGLMHDPLCLGCPLSSETALMFKDCPRCMKQMKEREESMVCLPEVKMPNNCHECDAFGISDVVGLKCPCESDRSLYSFDRRPEKCPLKEIKNGL